MTDSAPKQPVPATSNQAHIVLVTGRKRAGKSTFSKALCEARKAQGYGQVSLVSFAGRLKEILESLTMFSFTDEAWLDKYKEATFPAGVAFNVDELLLPHWDSFFPGLPSPGPLGLVARTPRQLMQIVGTEYVRRQDDAYWTKFLADEVIRPKLVQRSRAHLVDLFVVSDLRFLSEAEGVRAFASASKLYINVDVVRIRRLPEPAPVDGHRSETELESIKADFDLGFPDDSVDLLRGVAEQFALHRYRP